MKYPIEEFDERFFSLTVEQLEAAFEILREAQFEKGKSNDELADIGREIHNIRKELFRREIEKQDQSSEGQ